MVRLILCAISLAALPASAEDVGKLIRECDEIAGGPITSGCCECAKLEAVAKKSTDQAALAKIALESKYDASARHSAAGRLTDQALLSKVSETGWDPIVRARATAALDPSNPSLKRISGYSDTPGAIARIKLAVQDPIIRARFPRIVFTAQIGEIFQSYGSNSAKPGESVHFALSQDGKTLAEKSWKTNFPGVIDYSVRPGSYEGALAFQRADLDGSGFLKVLLAYPLNNPAIDIYDLKKLSNSEIPELRDAAEQRIREICAGPRNMFNAVCP